MKYHMGSPKRKTIHTINAVNEQDVNHNKHFENIYGQDTDEPKGPDHRRKAR